MRPPRRRRPRPSAPAALPPLPPILCLLSRSWHLSQRARFPAHPFAAGSERGREYGEPREEGTGKARRLRAPQTAETARERRRCPHARAPLFCGEVADATAPRIPTRPPAAPAVPAAGEDRAPPLLGSPLHRPPPPDGARGRGGRREQRIRRPGPAPRPAAPRARPRRHAAPGAPSQRAPALRPLPPPAPGRGIAPRRPSGLRFRAPGPARPRRAGGRELLARPAPAALAPRRLLGRARRLRSKAPAAMIAGSGTRAHARARLWDPWLTDGPCNPRSLVPVAPSAPRTAARLSRLVPAGNSVRCRALDAAPGQRSGPTVAAGFPQGGARARATPRRLPGHRRPRGARGAQRGGSPDAAHGSRPAEAGVSAQCREIGNNFLLPRLRAQELRGEVQGRSFALSEPDGDAAGPGPHGSFPGPPGG
nr:translation initiation factor IF-2-like [Symphalangus syndactylus]